MLRLFANLWAISKFPSSSPSPCSGLYKTPFPSFVSSIYFSSFGGVLECPSSAILARQLFSILHLSQFPFYFNCGIFCSLVSFHTMHLSVTIQMAIRTLVREMRMILAKYLLCPGRIAFKSSLWLGHFRCSPGRCLLQNGSSMGRVCLFLKTRREPRES